MKYSVVSSQGKWSRRLLHAAIGIIGLILAGLLLIPTRQPTLFLVELDSRQSCDRLTPVVGHATDRFELTGAWWLGGKSESGHCVISVEVSGFNAMAAVNQTRVIHFLREQAGMPQARLARTIVLQDRHGAGFQ